MPTQERIDMNKIILKNFLDLRPIPYENRLPLYLAGNNNKPNLPFGYIYCIENKKDHKKYIGSTYSIWTDIKNPDPFSSIKKRASHYIYEYNNALETIKDPIKAKKLRPIIYAMANEGIQNFIMYPIAETSATTHVEAENYFITFYKGYTEGYNVAPSVVNIYRSPSSSSMTNEQKKLRSDKIICINTGLKQILLSDSMKLFADYLKTSKDIIKTANRSGKTARGWNIFYMDITKRHYILDNNVLGEGLPKHYRLTSSESIARYKTLLEAVDELISDSKDKSKYFAGYTVLKSLEYE